jgi:hypothetical protein
MAKVEQLYREDEEREFDGRYRMQAVSAIEITRNLTAEEMLEAVQDYWRDRANDKYRDAARESRRREQDLKNGDENLEVALRWQHYLRYLRMP